jgi:hypothetical protein
VILELKSSSGSALVENCTEVNLWRSESNSTYREATHNVKLNWKDLIGTSDFNWNFHCEIFELVLWWLVHVLANQVFATSCENCSIRSKLKPYLKLTVTLNITKGWIEFQIWFQIFWEKELNLH